MSDTEQMIREHKTSRSWIPFLIGTVPLIACMVTILVLPYTFGHSLMAPKIAVKYAELNGTTPLPAPAFPWLNWVIVFAIIFSGAFLMMWFVSVFRVAESGVETVDGIVVDEPQERPLLRSGK